MIKGQTKNNLPKRWTKRKCGKDTHKKGDNTILQKKPKKGQTKKFSKNGQLKNGKKTDN
jgi:hypothetical protein